MPNFILRLLLTKKIFELEKPCSYRHRGNCFYKPLTTKVSIDLDASIYLSDRVPDMPTASETTTSSLSDHQTISVRSRELEGASSNGVWGVRGERPSVDSSVPRVVGDPAERPAFGGKVSADPTGCCVGMDPARETMRDIVYRPGSMNGAAPVISKGSI